MNATLQEKSYLETNSY